MTHTAAALAPHPMSMWQSPLQLLGHQHRSCPQLYPIGPPQPAGTNQMHCSQCVRPADDQPTRLTNSLEKAVADVAREFPDEPISGGGQFILTAAAWAADRVTHFDPLQPGPHTQAVDRYLNQHHTQQTCGPKQLLRITDFGGTLSLMADMPDLKPKIVRLYRHPRLHDMYSNWIVTPANMFEQGPLNPNATQNGTDTQPDGPQLQLVCDVPAAVDDYDLLQAVAATTSDTATVLLQASDTTHTTLRNIATATVAALSQ